MLSWANVIVILRGALEMDLFIAKAAKKAGKRLDNILDDDLRNDTCQSNLADERYLLNSGMINSNRLKMQGIYKKSKTNMIDSFENYEDMSGNDQYSQLRERLADSLYSNTEY